MAATTTGRRARLTFRAKAIAAAGLVILADRLFFDHDWGSTIGVFALVWTALAAALQPAVRRDRRARVALLAAVVLALVQVEHFSPLASLLFWTALSMAVLLPRTAGFDDAWRWGQRLAWHGLAGLFGPPADALRLHQTGGLPSLGRGWALLPSLILPLAGGLVFLALFAAANPVISDVLARLRLPRLDEDLFPRLVFAGVVLVAVWGGFRPRLRRRLFPLPDGAERRLPGVSAASVTLSLIVFNALFALQNTLDLTYLWSGAGLPEGMTLAAYAHRGAFPLIATALLAGLFVLVALSPGSETSRRPLVRRLVGLWVAQNIFLVASTMLRTLAYVDAYSLTALRIAALAWMTLVAIGLALIGWRLLRNKSTAWLVNANAAAALCMLALSAAFHFDGVAAAWNVRHAREAGGRGAALDLCYLQRSGEAALVSLARLEARTPDGAFRDRVTFVRTGLQRELQAQQLDWRAWTARGARRLASARAIAAKGRPSRGAARDRAQTPVRRRAPAAAAPLPQPAPGACSGRFRTAARPRRVDAVRPALKMTAMPPAILVVDDDPHIRQLLTFALNKAGMETLEAADGEAALAAVASQAPPC
jgi:hypothetical protein